MSGEGDLSAISRLISRLHVEVFERRPHTSSRPLNQSNHPTSQVIIAERTHGVLMTATNAFIWGPGGSSNQMNSGTSSCTWMGDGVWG